MGREMSSQITCALTSGTGWHGIVCPCLRLPNYKPRVMVAISSSANPTTTSQKPSAGVILRRLHIQTSQQGEAGIIVNESIACGQASCQMKHNLAREE